jgi:phage gp46-like protein
MMELALRNGDYVPDNAGGLRRVAGREALLQRVLFRLTARRGMFPFREDLGSRLWKLGQLSASTRQAAAKQYVVEALAEETELTVEEVTLAQQETGVELTVELSYEGETLSVTVELQI